MKKNHLLTIALVISLLFGAYNFFSLKEQKKAANDLFMFSLSGAQAGFASNFSTLAENDKIFYCIKVSSDLHTALTTINSTSYANIENRQALSSALRELYFYMSELDSVTSRWEALAEKSDLIYDYLHYIVINPNDKKSCEALSKLASNLRLNVEPTVIDYKATSPDWTVDYKVDGTVYSHDTYYTFKYTGNNADLIQKVNYSFDSSNEGEDGNFKLDKNKVYTGKLKLTAGFPKSTDRDITVKIEWNGKKELLILKEF